MRESMAHIERIKQTYAIDGADSIEMAQVLDWHVVVKKGEFKVGDLAVYIEIDSIVPDGLPSDHKEEMERRLSAYSSSKRAKEPADVLSTHESSIAELTKLNNRPEFEFLRGRKFKIKCVNYNKFKIISQGILFPLSILSCDTNPKESLDVTNILGITRIIEDEGESTEIQPGVLGFLESNSIGKYINRKLMRYQWFREFKKSMKPKGKWHDYFPSKSDETNAQAVFTKMKQKYGDRKWYVTEKLEGQNISAVSIKRKLFGLFDISTFGVCSHSRFLPTNDGSAFWKTVLRLGYKDILGKINKSLFVRGEHCGRSIQGGIYGFPENEIFVFDVYEIDSKRMLPYTELVQFCKQHDLKMVPVIDDNFTLPDTVQELLDYSNGYSVYGNKVLREGVVLRLIDDPRVSFKARSPKYLAKEK